MENLDSSKLENLILKFDFNKLLNLVNKKSSFTEKEIACISALFMLFFFYSENSELKKNLQNNSQFENLTDIGFLLSLIKELESCLKEKFSRERKCLIEKENLLITQKILKKSGIFFTDQTVFESDIEKEIIIFIKQIFKICEKDFDIKETDEINWFEFLTNKNKLKKNRTKSKKQHNNKFNNAYNSCRYNPHSVNKELDFKSILKIQNKSKIKEKSNLLIKNRKNFTEGLKNFKEKKEKKFNVHDTYENKTTKGNYIIIEKDNKEIDKNLFQEKNENFKNTSILNNNSENDNNKEKNENKSIYETNNEKEILSKEKNQIKSPLKKFINNSKKIAFLNKRVKSENKKCFVKELFVEKDCDLKLNKNLKKISSDGKFLKRSSIDLGIFKKSLFPRKNSKDIFEKKINIAQVSQNKISNDKPKNSKNLVVNEKKEMMEEITSKTVINESIIKNENKEEKNQKFEKMVVDKKLYSEEKIKNKKNIKNYEKDENLKFNNIKKRIASEKKTLHKPTLEKTSKNITGFFKTKNDSKKLFDLKKTETKNKCYNISSFEVKESNDQTNIEKSEIVPSLTKFTENKNQDKNLNFVTTTKKTKKFEEIKYKSNFKNINENLDNLQKNEVQKSDQILKNDFLKKSISKKGRFSAKIINLKTQPNFSEKELFPQKNLTSKIIENKKESVVKNFIKDSKKLLEYQKKKEEKIDPIQKKFFDEKKDLIQLRIETGVLKAKIEREDKKKFLETKINEEREDFEFNKKFVK